MKNARTLAFLGALACSAAALVGCASDEAATCSDSASCSDKAATCSDAKSCSDGAAGKCCSESKDAAKN
jgi:hypothetical protein